ncbi:SUF system Fe-S cluster assembly regulator [Acetobacter garciniae]|uniref:SUF system Fe-S cluster assembly regulator n=1 Tax=Acetobacter garciniae TaxID=2817435 RepID=UPI001E3EB2BF|nr:SUF system Fe-S cluster assembly regulator [Acetobacter garciniae]
MLKLSRLADYAIVILVRLGEQAGVVTSPCLAHETGVPEPTVAKVLKVLAGDGFVLSQRGAKGGYRLARPLADISVASVITAVDGKIALTACVDGGGCDNGVSCSLCGSWDTINQAIRTTLEGISLESMRQSQTIRPPRPYAGNGAASTVQELRGGA